MEKTKVDAISDRRAFTISEFCARYAISVRSFYNNEQLMPPTIRIGRRRVILVDCLRDWERERLCSAKTERPIDEQVA